MNYFNAILICVVVLFTLFAVLGLSLSSDDKTEGYRGRGRRGRRWPRSRGYPSYGWLWASDPYSPYNPYYNYYINTFPLYSSYSPFSSYSLGGSSSCIGVKAKDDQGQWMECPSSHPRRLVSNQGVSQDYCCV